MKKYVIAALREDVAKYQSSSLKVNSPIEIYLFLAYKNHQSKKTRYLDQFFHHFKYKHQNFEPNFGLKFQQAFSSFYNHLL